MKKVAVTGAQGFVGSAVVKALRHQGYTVIPVVRKSNGLFADALEWDITNPHKNTFPDVDVVVHSAAKVDDWATYADSYQVNVLGTKNVIHAFPKAELIIYVSSASVYDPKNKDLIITEKSAAGTNLQNDYSRTKFEAEKIVLEASLPSRVVLRPHIIYGPGDTHILPRLLKARRFGRFLILGNGKNAISLTHIENLVGAIAQLVSTDKKFAGEIFNVADDKTDSIETVINTLKRTLNITEKNFYIPTPIARGVGIVLEFIARLVHAKESPLLTPYIVEQMTSHHIINCQKAKEMFGYGPTIEYTEGFKRL